MGLSNFSLLSKPTKITPVRLSKNLGDKEKQTNKQTTVRLTKNLGDEAKQTNKQTTVRLTKNLGDKQNKQTNNSQAYTKGTKQKQQQQQQQQKNNQLIKQTIRQQRKICDCRNVVIHEDI